MGNQKRNKENARKKTEKNLHAGHRARLRALFLNTHDGSLSDHQLLELLLFYSIPRVDTNATAHRLIETFGSVNGVFNARYEHLQDVEGVGEKTALLIKLIPEIMRRAGRNDTLRLNKIKSLDELGRYMVDFFAFDTSESAALICVNKNRRIISINRLKCNVGRGDGNALDEILAICLNAKPHTVVLAHLHPEGCAAPSRDDMIFTHSLKNALEALRILLMEHFVITHEGYTRILNSLDYDLSKTFEI